MTGNDVAELKIGDCVSIHRPTREVRSVAVITHVGVDEFLVEFPCGFESDYDGGIGFGYAVRLAQMARFKLVR